MRLNRRVPFAVVVLLSFGIMAACDRDNESAAPVQSAALRSLKASTRVLPSLPPADLRPAAPHPPGAPALDRAKVRRPLPRLRHTGWSALPPVIWQLTSAAQSR